MDFPKIVLGTILCFVGLFFLINGIFTPVIEFYASGMDLLLGVIVIAGGIKLLRDGRKR